MPLENINFVSLEQYIIQEDCKTIKLLLWSIILDASKVLITRRKNSLIEEVNQIIDEDELVDKSEMDEWIEGGRRMNW